MIPVDILKLIPQKPPFVFVDSIVFADEKKAETIFEIILGKPLVADGFLSEAGLMENIAQTVAAKAGYDSFLKNSPVEKGFIVAVKNFVVHSLPAVGQQIRTSITIQENVMNLTVIHATVSCIEKIIATCEMSILIEEMKRETFIIADHILSPLGNSTEENFNAIKNGQSGIKKHTNISISEKPFYASLLEQDNKYLSGTQNGFTKFEKMLVATIKDLSHQIEIDFKSERLLLIISSTKGNIHLLETENYNSDLENKIALPTSAKKIAAYFELVHTPIVLSNACISGIAAILTGKRLLETGKYDFIIVSGADVISKFILSGFESFQAVSDLPCKPFDKNRNGITLGEAAASVLLSVFPRAESNIKVAGGAISNDANHISAPSRTGRELNMAIQNSLNESAIARHEIDFISAHGTATLYNDEMESKALHLSGFENTLVNSLKGFFGHTLGAAGLVESIVSIKSMKENTMIPTAGFKSSGASTMLNVCKNVIQMPIHHCLKIASGFGGCNAAVVFSKINS